MNKAYALPLDLRTAAEKRHSYPALWVGAGMVALLGLTTANPLLTALSVLFVPLALQLLWRPGEPPALLFVVMFQWLQVTTRVYHADFVGVEVSSLMLTPSAPGAMAVALGLVALVTLTVGQRAGAGPWYPSQYDVGAERNLFSPARLFVLYLGLNGLGMILVGMRWQFLGLSQAFGAVAQLKWVPLFALGHIAVASRRGRGWLLAATLIEIVLGFGGYFGGFKIVFYVLILAALSARVRLSIGQTVLVGTLCSVVFGLSLVWTGIKPDYRAYLNQGEQQQIVLVSWEERLTEFGRLAGALSPEDFGPTLEKGMDRLAYVDLLAEALAYVPESTPHTGGTIWGAAIANVLAPRILFPAKPILESDSELASRYTGVNLASGDQGTNISLGYAAESYVDFGVPIMWFPIFLMGLLQGWSYRFFLSHSPSRLLGYGIAVAALLPALYFETATVKYLGGTLFLILALGVVARYAIPTVLPWLTRGEMKRLSTRKSWF